MWRIAVCWLILILCGRPQTGAPQVSARDLYFEPASAGRVLGMRVSILARGPLDATFLPADPARVFTTGECFTLFVQVNRAAHLYVLARSLSGGWITLLPSPEVQGESFRIDAAGRARVPRKHCIEFVEPAGEESLLVIASVEPVALGDRTMSAVPLATLDPLVRRLGARGLRIAKVHEPSEPDSFVTYAVAGPESRGAAVALKITLRHEGKRP